MARSKRTTPPSTNKREYDRLRNNILARMRYREKQGFKVDYTTKPQILAKPTKRDIERLSNTQVGLNRYGEIIAQRTGRKAYVTKPTRQQVLSAKEYLQQMGYKTEPNEDYKNTKEQLEVDLDYIGMVYGGLERIKEWAQRFYDDSTPQGNSWKADEYGDAFNAIYEYGFARVDSEVNKHGEQRVNQYYKLRFQDISKVINEIIKIWDSEPDRLAMTGMKMLDWVLIVP